MAVTIASVAVQTNATSSESLIATPLHTEGDPVPGSRILPDIWTSPASPLRLTIHHREIVFLRICHSRDDPPPGGHRLLGGPSRLLEARRLTADPFACSEACRLTADPFACSEARRLTEDPLACSETCCFTADPVSYSEACRLTADPVAYPEARRLQGVTSS